MHSCLVRALAVTRFGSMGRGSPVRVQMMGDRHWQIRLTGER
jgi:hypothetical protein